MRALPIVLGALLSVAPDAWAMELGALSVESTLGQRLHAEIEIVSTSEEDSSGMRVGLADNATYERFGVVRPDISSEIDVAVATSDDRKPVIRISSRKPIHALFLNLLLRVEDRDVQLIREVAILLDPSVLQSAPATGNGATTIPRAASSSVHVVVAGDSLMRIAQRFTPSSARPEQTAIALYEANPEAFLGSIHRLIVGARLVLPTEAAIRTYSAADARAVIRAGIEDFKRRQSGSTRDDGLLERVPAQAIPPQEDDLALQDFQAVVANLQGDLHDLQGTLEERLAQLDGLNSQVDALIDERQRIRASAERERTRVADAGTAELAQALARADAAERALSASEAARVAEAMSTVPRANSPPANLQASLDANTPPGIGEPDIGESSPDVDGLLRQAAPPAVVAASVDRAAASGPGASLDTEEAASAPRLVALPPLLAREVSGRVSRGESSASGGRRDTVRSGDDGLATPTRVRDRQGTATGDPAGTGSERDPSAARATGDPAWVVDRTSGDGWTWQAVMQALRDGGLIVLALCMIHVLFSRRFRRDGDPATPRDSKGGKDEPDEALDFFLLNSSNEGSKEELLRSVLTDFPRRQDIRLQLLELYAESRSTNLFGDEARIMYRMTRGNTPEWHRAVELGLELDADIDFYKIVIEDDLFDTGLDTGLSEEDRVSSVPAGGSTRPGSSGPSVSFEELMQLHSAATGSEESDALEDTPVEEAPDGDGPVDLDAKWTDTSAHEEEAPGGDGPVDLDAKWTDTSAHEDDRTVGEILPLVPVLPVPLHLRPVYVPRNVEELLSITVNYTYGIEKLDIHLGDSPGERGNSSELSEPIMLDASDEPGEPGESVESVESVESDVPGGPDMSIELDTSDMQGDPGESGDPSKSNISDGAMDFFTNAALVDDTDDIGSTDHTVSTDHTDAPPANFVTEFVDSDKRTEAVSTSKTIAGNLSDDLSDGLHDDLASHTDDVELNLNLAETYVDDHHHEEARRLIDELLPRTDADQRRRAEALLERIDGPPFEGRAVG